MPVELRRAVWTRDRGYCGICNELADPLDWNLDHIVPFVLGGPTTLHNLRVTHPRCNRARTKPSLMSEDEIEMAAGDWTTNEMADWPTLEEWVAAHPTGSAVTDGEWTCRCALCESWRAKLR